MVVFYLLVSICNSRAHHGGLVGALVQSSDSMVVKVEGSAHAIAVSSNSCSESCNLSLPL